MTTRYPAQIDTTNNLPTVVDNDNGISGVMINRLRDAILAIEGELGVQPSKPYGTVRKRLDDIENLVISNTGIQLGSDLGGNNLEPLVIGLYGNPVSNTTPEVNQILSWNGIVWEPVNKPEINDILPTPNSIGETILWNGSSYVAGKYSLDDLLPPFSVILMSVNEIVEVNQPVVHPTFSGSYSSIPSSVTLKDSENNVIQTLSNFNNFSSDFSFTKNSFGAFVDFTLTAVMGRFTKNGNARITWGQKSYWGLGSPGETGSSFITNLSNNILTISSNISFSITAGSGQKIYFACRSGYGNLVFTMNNVQGGFTKTGTFAVTNSFGFVENYDLYESNLTNLGATNILVSNGLELLSVNALMNSIVHGSPYGNTGATIAGTYINSVGPGIGINKILKTTTTSSCDWVDLYPTLVIKSTNSLLGISDKIVLVNTLVGVITITLPNSGLVSGMEFIIKDVGDASINQIIIDGNGNDIDGLSTYEINSDHGYVRLVTNGSDWFVIGEG